MSGIAGILRRDGRPIPEKWVKWLEEAISQRGSDGAGKFQDAIEVSTGTLEIVLLHQQMGSNDISQPIVFERDDEYTAVVVIDGPAECAPRSLPISFPVDVPYAAAWWDANDLQLHLIRGGSGQKPLYMLDLGEAGDGIVFCSVPTPLNTISRELALSTEMPVSAVQQYLQLGFVTGDLNLISPVRVVPLSTDSRLTPSTNQTPIQHALVGSPSPASDLLELVSQLGQPFADSTLLSRLWTYKEERNQTSVIRHGLVGNTSVVQRAKSLASWHGIQSVLPGQTVARDWVKFGITTVHALCPFTMIEQITGHEYQSPYSPHFDGSIETQLAEFDATCRTPDSVLRGVDAAAMVADVEVCVDGDSKPYSFQPIPIATWFRSEQGDLGQLAGDVFTSTNAFDQMPIEQSIVEKLFEDHRSGRASHEEVLFALLTLALWLRLEV